MLNCHTHTQTDTQPIDDWYLAELDYMDDIDSHKHVLFSNVYFWLKILHSILLLIAFESFCTFRYVWQEKLNRSGALAHLHWNIRLICYRYLLSSTTRLGPSTIKQTTAEWTSERSTDLPNKQQTVDKTIATDYHWVLHR